MVQQSLKMKSLRHIFFLKCNAAETVKNNYEEVNYSNPKSSLFLTHNQQQFNPVHKPWHNRLEMIQRLVSWIKSSNPAKHH